MLSMGMCGSASQAENASSILVARSRLAFVATTDKVVANIAVGFRHGSPLFAPVRHLSLSQHCRHLSLSQHCRNPTTAVHHESSCLASRVISTDHGLPWSLECDPSLKLAAGFLNAVTSGVIRVQS